MIKAVKLSCFAILLFLLSTFSPSFQNREIGFLFNIKNIEIENNKILNSKEIILELQEVKGNSLLFLDKEPIKTALSRFDFISNFQIKKIYPQTIRIRIFEEDLVAIYFDEKNKFYISEKGKLMNYIELDNYKNLPILFGGKKGFSNFFKDLKKINFPIKKVQSFHYYKIGRWDITLEKQIVLKLPKNNYLDSLENFLSINEKTNFEKYKIFDYRIKDQLILN